MKTALLALFCLYALYAGIMVWLHPKFIYPFQPQEMTDARFERHEISGPAGTTVLYHAPAKTTDLTVVYYMGNAGALPLFQVMFDHYLSRGHGVIAMAYPGGGGLPGQATETGLKAAALDVYDWAQEHAETDVVIVHGYSLGSGLALHVARDRPVDGVILGAPYARLCRLMTRASYLPACLLPGVQDWKSDLDAPHVTAPIRVLHGTKDTLIPIAEGRRLFASLRPHAKFVEVEGAGHTDLLDFEAFRNGIDAFLAELLSGKPKSN